MKAELDGSAPAPFPQSAQYQKAFKEEKDPGAEPEEDEKTKKKEKNKSKKQKADVRKICQKPEVEPPVLDQEISVYKAKEYSNLRSKFLTAARQERGLSNQEAADEWNQSSLKRKLLGSLSVSELR